MASEHNGMNQGGAAGQGDTRQGASEGSLRGDAGAAYPQAWAEGSGRGSEGGTRDWSSGRSSQRYSGGGMMSSVSEAGSSVWTMVSSRPWLATALGGLGLWLVMGRRRDSYMPYVDDLRSYGDMVGDYADRARSYLGRSGSSLTSSGTMAQGYEMARSTVSREPLAAMLGAGILLWMTVSWLMRDD